MIEAMASTRASREGAPGTGTPGSGAPGSGAPGSGTPGSGTPGMAPAATSTAAERRVEPVPGLDELVAAIMTLRTAGELRLFLRDLCTLPELEALAHRWQTARLLEQGVPYVEIAERVPTSTATVTRVAQWLKHGTGGYRLALARTAAGRLRAGRASEPPGRGVARRAAR